MDPMRTNDPFQLTLVGDDTSAGRHEDAHGQLIATFQNATVIAPFPGADRSAWRRMCRMHERLRRALAGEGGPKDMLAEGELREFGELLYRTLLPAEIGRLYDVGRTLVGQNLEFRFLSTVNRWAELPWELAWDPLRKSYLATEDTLFVRNVFTAVPAEGRSERPARLRILVVAAVPVGAIPLSADEEISLIRRGFGALEQSGAATIDVHRAMTPDALDRLLHPGRYDVLHFIGHGSYSDEEKEGSLLFEDDRGQARRLGAATLRELIPRRGLRLVFLNACETGRSAPPRGSALRDFNRGVAPALVAAGVPAVIANQYPVLDASASAFARAFYSNLASGLGIAEAAKRARVAVKYLVNESSVDWAVPVVFARSPAERLCEEPKQPLALPADLTGVLTPRERPGLLEAGTDSPGTAEARRAIGVWDVNGSIPQLDSILARLNGCQRHYRFSSVRLSAPMGSWSTWDTDDQESLLRAEVVFEKLAGRPQQLGLDRLLCITQFRLGAYDAQRKEDWENLYMVDDPDGGPICVASLWQLTQHFTEPGLSMALCVAGFLVTMLAMSDGKMEVHSGGPKQCPGYFNIERDPRYIAGRLHFDARCRAKIRKSSGAVLEALEAMLSCPGLQDQEIPPQAATPALALPLPDREDTGPMQRIASIMADETARAWITERAEKDMSKPSARELLKLLSPDISIRRIPNLEFMQSAIEELRPAPLIHGGIITMDDRSIWNQHLARINTWLPQVAAAVGRVEYHDGSQTPHQRGTAWLVADRLVVTNQHVVYPYRDVAQRLRVVFTEGPDRPARQCIGVTSVRYIAQSDAPDLAILELQGNPPHADGSGMARALILADSAPPARTRIGVIGFPDGNARPVELAERVFGKPSTYFSERLSPGTIVEHRTESLHDASTTAGSSGSPLVDLSSGAVLGVHAGESNLMPCNAFIPILSVRQALKRAGVRQV